MSGRRSRDKGKRVERELVAVHRALGIHSERYPLSGASRFRNSGHDLDLYINGLNAASAVAEVKARKNGAGWTVIERQLGTFDLLFLKANNKPPLVVIPWRTWADLLAKVRR